MKKHTIGLLTGIFLMILAISTGQAMAETSIVVAQDYAPRMMNPHGDDSDAGLSYFSNFFDGLLQRKGSSGELVPALALRGFQKQKYPAIPGRWSLK